MPFQRLPRPPRPHRPPPPRRPPPPPRRPPPTKENTTSNRILWTIFQIKK